MTLTLKNRIQGELAKAATTVSQMRAPVVVVANDTRRVRELEAEVERLQAQQLETARLEAAKLARVKSGLEAEVARLRAEQVERAHRQLRVDAITISVVDGLETWRRKMGIDAQPRKITIRPGTVYITDVFAAPPMAEE
jgi:D-aminopeptidase